MSYRNRPSLQGVNWDGEGEPKPDYDEPVVATPPDPRPDYVQDFIVNNKSPRNSPKPSPKMQRRQLDNEPPKLVINPAYERHRANHLRYATIRGKPNYSNCPICQIFEADEAVKRDQQSQSQNRLVVPSPVMKRNSSDSSIPGVAPRGAKAKSPHRRLSDDMNGSLSSDKGSDDGTVDIIEEREDGYLMEVANPQATFVLVCKSRRGETIQELSVKRGEKLEVIDNNGNWWACCNDDGYAGYVPRDYLRPFKKEKKKQMRQSIVPQQQQQQQVNNYRGESSRNNAYMIY